MIEKIKNLKQKINIFMVIAFVLIIEFSFFGLEYFKITDDNNQIGCYYLRNDDTYNNVIMHYKNYEEGRPLIFFLEAYVFSALWNKLYILEITIILMHALSIYLIYKIAEKIEVKINTFALILIAFMPLVFEGLYWISASDRTVISLFLMLWSIYLFLVCDDETNKIKKTLKIILACFLNLACVGFYEQTIALNFVLAIVIFIIAKKYKYIAMPIISTISIGIFYILNVLKGTMHSRGTISFSGIFENMGAIITKLGVFGGQLLTYIKESLIRVPHMFEISISAILLAIGIGALCYFIYKDINNEKKEKESLLRKIIIGAIIFIIPLIPFLILKSMYIEKRNMYIVNFRSGNAY